MTETTQTDFDKLVQHTVRIELKDGSTLLYPVSRKSKRGLHSLLLNNTISMTDLSFIWFHILKDRLVLVNRNDIIRITFCFDAVDDKEPEYKDNFDMVISPEEAGLTEEDIDNDPPQLIVKHNRQLENTELVREMCRALTLSIWMMRKNGCC